MTDSPARHPVAIPALIGVVLLGLAVWFILGNRTDPAVQECTALYHAARTAEDTTRADLTVPAAAADHAEARSCGSLRMSGRWQ